MFGLQVEFHLPLILFCTTTVNTIGPSMVIKLFSDRKNSFQAKRNLMGMPNKLGVFLFYYSILRNLKPLNSTFKLVIFTLFVISYFSLSKRNDDDIS